MTNETNNKPFRQYFSVADDDNKPSTVELATADTAVDYLCELTQYLFGCLVSVVVVVVLCDLDDPL